MNRFSMPFGLALSALSLLTAALPAHADERPIKATGGGYIAIYSGLGHLDGLGESTHLGHSRLGVEIQGANYLHAGFFSPRADSFLRSASGDLLYFDFDEVYYYFDPETGVITTTVTFTGGTGRFQDATGSADVMFVLDWETGQFSFLFDGSIDY